MEESVTVKEWSEEGTPGEMPAGETQDGESSADDLSSADDRSSAWDRTEFDALLIEAKQKGYRKQELAEMLGVAPPTFSNWISGKHEPHTIFQARFPELRRKLKDRRADRRASSAKKGAKKKG